MIIPTVRSPILLLVYNRPDTTSVLINKVREIRPNQLYISADAPIKSLDEEKKCAEVRSIVEQINWDCNLITLYQDNHLGCRKAVSTAISWFFSHVEEGIILEDDCIPNYSFFRFCDEMLAYYRNDKRVMQVCGSNLVGNNGLRESYFFSRFGSIWGWATWRRAWQYYDVEMKLWPKVKNEYLVDFFCDTPSECKWREKLFDQVFNNEIDTWDYQWSFAKLVQSGLSVVPRENMIRNTGFHSDATHTKKMPRHMKKLTQLEMEYPLKHPETLLRHKKLDDYFFCNVVKRGQRRALFYSIVSQCLSKLSPRKL